MIPAFTGTPGSVRVLVATRPGDFRKGMGGLAALVKDQLLKDPYSGRGLRLQGQAPTV